MKKFDKDHPSVCSVCGHEATFRFCENRAGYAPCLDLPGVPRGHRLCQGCRRQWAEEASLAPS